MKHRSDSRAAAGLPRRTEIPDPLPPVPPPEVWNDLRARSRRRITRCHPVARSPTGEGRQVPCSELRVAGEPRADIRSGI